VADSRPAPGSLPPETCDVNRVEEVGEIAFPFGPVAVPRVGVHVSGGASIDECTAPMPRHRGSGVDGGIRVGLTRHKL